jgi:hypothetical protein
MRRDGGGADSFAALARQIVILVDGATTVMLIHRELDYVNAAGRLAQSLVEEARQGRLHFPSAT